MRGEKFSAARAIHRSQTGEKHYYAALKSHVREPILAGAPRLELRALFE